MHRELLTDRDDLFVIHNFLSSEECTHYIAMAEEAGFGDAPINSFDGPVIIKRYRNNDRVMLDNPELAAHIWERLKPFVPDRSQFWLPMGLNERMRFYRYDPGQQFDWHFDGHYERSPLEVSAFTFMVYLNGWVAGGATEFQGVLKPDRILRVQPEEGKALVFPHKILHRGAPVENGRKYVLRSDVMCRWAGEK